MIALVLLAAAGAVPLGQAVQESIDATECKPRRGKDDIIVCANRNHVSPYRLPDRNQPFDPFGDTKSVMNERVGWASQGDVGTQSCGPVGPGGWTGCMVRVGRKAATRRNGKRTFPSAAGRLHPPLVDQRLASAVSA